MRDEIKVIWKKALELGFQFNETDAQEMFIALKPYIKEHEVLTLEKLKDMLPGEMIKTGVVENERLHDSPVRFVAVRGGFHDWTIYYHFEHKDVEEVRSGGNKVMSEDIIRELVPCNDDAYKMYRY